ncbi:MAG: PBP1A family penicillin-binding protein [Pseudomonadota bacterium]
MSEVLKDLTVGVSAGALWAGRKAFKLAQYLPWTSLRQPALGLASAAMTLAIPLLALNAEAAKTVFPASDVDLASAGRQPNILILGADGIKLGSRGSDLGEPVTLDILPKYVVDAFLSTEDRQFYRHPGFDVAAVLRAILANWRAGGVVQGGSTITQQLVKNLFLSGEQSFSRKHDELHLALWLEARLTKDEILELYLNRIYLGANTYGLSAASSAYFSKNPSELTLSEAALLAGLPKAPSALAPHTNLEGALARSREVIDNLLETRRIDKLTAMVAAVAPPRISLRNARDSDGYFLDHVAAELPRVIDDLNQDVVVITTLSPPIQTAADRAVKDALENDQAIAKGAEHGALIAYDRDGGIVAMVGGRRYEDSQFNRATQARRQPGSAFKPFIYAAAIEAGFDQNTVLVDQPIQVNGWQPTNYKERFLGALRLREALARSSNTTTVQVTEAVGRELVIDTARRAGLKSALEPHPSLALGSFEVPLDELTAAYLPFAHHGQSKATFAIREVRARDGTVLYQRTAPEPLQLFSEQTAERMTDLLHGVTVSGTGSSARVPGHEVAGKTGTTNEWRDAWFVGYSAHLTAGVWVGNDAYDPMEKVSGATYPARIWSAFMAEAHNAAGLDPLPLAKGQELRRDPELTSLRGTYALLQSDLERHAYPGQPYSNRNRGIRSLYGLIRRETQPVVGRLATDEDPS